MVTPKTDPPRRTRPDLAEVVGKQAVAKLNAQRRPIRGVWSGIGLIGVIGWSVALPTLGGTALGIYLDRRFAGPHSWTLALLVLGVIVGCVLAWHWVKRETRSFGKEDDDAR